MRTKLFILLAMLPFIAWAQPTDSLFISRGTDNRWYARYFAEGERNVFDVAKKFGLAVAAVADANELSYTDRLSEGAALRIPLTVANWYNYTPPPSSVVEPLYFRTAESWDISVLARQLGVAKRELEEWNGIVVPMVTAGRVLRVGWVSMGSTAKGGTVWKGETGELPAQPDTILLVDTASPTPVLSPMEQAFLDQTAGGTMVTTEKGPAAFFPARGGTINGIHYAFHNTASRGSIVRVFNPGTGRTVYVKVLGPLPGTKQYAGAIIGISVGAKEELGVRGDSRAWCEVSFAGY